MQLFPHRQFFCPVNNHPVPPDRPERRAGDRNPTNLRRAVDCALTSGSLRFLSLVTSRCDERTLAPQTLSSSKETYHASTTWKLCLYTPRLPQERSRRRSSNCGRRTLVPPRFGIGRRRKKRPAHAGGCGTPPFCGRRRNHRNRLLGAVQRVGRRS